MIYAANTSFMFRPSVYLLHKLKNKNMGIVKNVIVKMQRYEYMRRFLLYGEMYMNTLQTFTKMDECDGIGDKFENSISYINYKPIHAIFKLSNGKELKLHPTSIKVREFVDTNIGNIYSMALVDCNIQTIDNQLKFSIQNVDIINSIGNGYDSIVVILNPVEFISRCEKTIQSMGYKLYYDPVEYFSDNEFNKKIEITPFMKRDRYKSQNEFRLFVDFNSNEPQIIKIGNISDIAFLIHKSGICSLNDELPESI